MTTDTSEKGLELLIVRAMTGLTEVLVPPHVVTETAVPVVGGTGWLLGDAAHYDREYTVDVVQLRGFLRATQPRIAEALDLDHESPARRRFLARLQGEISKRGVIDVLRGGIKDGPHHVELFYGTPTPGNEVAAERYARNRFCVARQLRYSRDEMQRALDLAIFINGLPVATFELKNSLTKQTVEDAVEQYERDRSPREKLFELGRCAAHFAVDDHKVRFCAHLRGKGSWFLPFDQGWNDGAGNPPNPDGLKTEYLWKRILTREGSRTFSRATPSASRRRTKRPARRRWNKSGRGTTSSTSSGSSSRTPASVAPVGGTSSSTRPAAASRTQSPGSPTSSSA
jgi:type I restriction enzyme R subunit